MKKKIYIIYTGGTIGMMRTENGYSILPGYMKQQLLSISELQHDEMPDYDLHEYDPLLDSSSIDFVEWIKIAQDIQDHYDDYDGFVVLHGTDTMAYTASALSFMLEGLTKPVILTGSQIPFCEVRNDARDNVITAMMIAANYPLPEVCLYFGNVLLRGNRATKVSADALSAFESPNYPPLGIVGVDIQVQECAYKVKPDDKPTLFPFKEQYIGILKIFPGIQPDIFESIMTPKLKGLVVEAFGAGNIPSTDQRVKAIFKKAADNGTIIVVCTQCLRGSALIGEYETSKGLAEAGAVSGYDLTAEAAVTKLYYLLSKGYDTDEIKKLMQTDLRGEMTGDVTKEECR